MSELLLAAGYAVTVFLLNRQHEAERRRLTSLLVAREPEGERALRTVDRPKRRPTPETTPEPKRPQVD